MRDRERESGREREEREREEILVELVSCQGGEGESVYVCSIAHKHKLVSCMHADMNVYMGYVSI